MKIKENLLLIRTKNSRIFITFYLNIWIDRLTIMPKYGRKSLFPRFWLFLFRQWIKVHIKANFLLSSNKRAPGKKVITRVGIEVYSDSFFAYKILGLQLLLSQAQRLATPYVCEGMWWPGCGEEFLWGLMRRWSPGPSGSRPFPYFTLTRLLPNICCVLPWSRAISVFYKHSDDIFYAHYALQLSSIKINVLFFFLTEPRFSH